MQRVILLGVSLFFATTIFAQQPVATPPPVTNTIITVEEIPTSFYTVGVAEVSYFAEANSTKVHVELDSYGSKERSAGLFLNSTFPGKQPPLSPELSLGIRVCGERRIMEALSTFSLEADGESVALNNLRREGLTFEDYQQQWSRALKGNLTSGLFQKLVESKSVKVRVAELEFELSQKDRNALRDMLKALGQTTPKSKPS